jgi:hypothetical protein
MLQWLVLAFLHQRPLTAGGFARTLFLTAVSCVTHVSSVAAHQLQGFLVQQLARLLLLVLSAKRGKCKPYFQVLGNGCHGSCVQRVTVGVACCLASLLMPCTMRAAIRGDMYKYNT